MCHYAKLFRIALATLLMLVTMTGAAIAACSSADSEGNYSATKHVECLHQEADQGDRLSQYLLASVYFTGRFGARKTMPKHRNGISAQPTKASAVHSSVRCITRAKVYQGTLFAHICGSIWQRHRTFPMLQRPDIKLKGK